MSKDPRILNITRGFRLKWKQAERAIENCACVWVEPGVSVRNLSLAESIEARHLRAKQQEPLPIAELPGLRYDHPQRFDLIRAAQQFAGQK